MHTVSGNLFDFFRKTEALASDLAACHKLIIVYTLSHTLTSLSESIQQIVHGPLYTTSNEETFLLDFLETLKNLLQNFDEYILKH